MQIRCNESCQEGTPSRRQTGGEPGYGTLVNRTGPIVQITPAADLKTQGGAGNAFPSRPAARTDSRPAPSPEQKGEHYEPHRTGIWWGVQRISVSMSEHFSGDKTNSERRNQESPRFLENSVEYPTSFEAPGFALENGNLKRTIADQQLRRQQLQGNSAILSNP